MIPTKMGFAPYKSKIIELKGGINENVSSLELLGGELIDCRNYMISEGGYGGYKSVSGYERFDGYYKPSEYESIVLYIRDSALEVLATETITSSGGGTLVALETGTVISGSYAGGDAEVVIQCLIGNGTDLAIDETLSTSSGAVGSVRTLLAITGCTNDHYLALDYITELVNEVPGEGPILGVHVYNNLVYAFRKKVGVDQIGLYEESSAANGSPPPAYAGWAEVDTSGDPIVYSASGHDFKFTNYNFYASDITVPGNSQVHSMFWCDGVNQARYYTGNLVDPVVVIDNAGMSAQSLDKPINIIAHNYHLWLAYRGGSLQHSVLGQPDNFSGVDGAEEIGVGGEITNLEVGVQSTLLIFLEKGIRVLTGNTIDDFVLEVFSEQSGAYNGTAKRLLGSIYFIDDRGVTNLQAADTFGDYGANSLSQKFKQTLQNAGNNITCTVTNRDLNQYRIFYDDGRGIYMSFEGTEFIGATFTEFPDAVNVVAHGEDSTGKDLIVFGTGGTNGYVYRLDTGKSFDGEVISCRMGTAFYHYGSPRNYKAFKRATLEVAGELGQEFYVKVDFDYREVGNPRTIWYTPELYTPTGNAVWSAGKWSEMLWGAGVANRVPIYLQGVGVNMGYKVLSNERYRSPHIIQNIITDYVSVGRRI